MRDKFDYFNDIKVNEDDYDELDLDDNSDLEHRLMSKIKVKRNKVKIRKLVAASVLLLFGFGAIFKDDVYASIKNIFYSLSMTQDNNKDEINKHVHNINKSIEKQNIKVSFKNIAIFNGDILVNLNLDGSKFNPFKDFNEKKKKDYQIEKWGHKEREIDLGYDCIELYVDEKLIHFNHDYELVGGIDKNVKDVVLYKNIDKDSENEEERNEFPYKIEKNKTYNIKIKIRKIHIAEVREDIDISKLSKKKLEKLKNNPRYGGVVYDDWSITTSIKGSEIMDTSKKYNINKEININHDNKNMKINIMDLEINPMKLKLIYNINEELKEDNQFRYKIINDKNKEYRSHTRSEYTENEIHERYNNVYKDSKYIKIIPIIYNTKSEKSVQFNDKAIKVNLKK